MKAQLIQLFLRREHLIVLSRIVQYQASLLDPYQYEEQQLKQMMHIDLQNQKKENRLLRNYKYQQIDLEDIQNQMMHISNLTFSYIKLHMPINSQNMVKDHIKFTQQIKQINYGGLHIDEAIQLQRNRLQAERGKIIRQIKLQEEPLPTKILQQKVDFAIVETVHKKYFNNRQIDFRQSYSILNINTEYKKILRGSNKDLYNSINCIEDVPSLQIINTNQIQPILNFDTYNLTFEHRLQKLLNRNYQIQQTVKQYYATHKVQPESQTRKNSNCMTSRSLETKPQSIKQIRLKIQTSKQNDDMPGLLEELNRRVLTYKAEPQVVKKKNIKFYTSPSCNSSQTMTDKEKEKEKERERDRDSVKLEKEKYIIQTLQKPIEKIVIKPINYQNLCYGESKRKTKISIIEPNEDKKIQDTQNPMLVLPSVPANLELDIQTTSNRRTIKDFQMSPYSKRKQITKEEYARRFQNPTKLQIPLLNRKNLLNPGQSTSQFTYNLFNNYKSEQLIASLITSCNIKNKQSEIYQQFLQPIKIQSHQKVLSSKDQLQGKYKQLRVDTKIIEIN